MNDYRMQLDLVCLYSQLNIEKTSSHLFDNKFFFPEFVLLYFKILHFSEILTKN